MRVKNPCLLFVSVLLALATSFGAPPVWAAPASTATTLTITLNGNTVPPGGSIASGTGITLTATVKAGTIAVAPGQVNLCDASATSCTDIHLLGTAQLIQAGPSMGEAVFRLHPGLGHHIFKAFFAGTPNGTSAYAGSASSAMALTVTGTFPTKASLVASGTQGNYSLKSTVTGLVNASGVAAPSGMVSFLDTSSGNSSLASVALGAGTEALSFENSGNFTTGVNPNSVAVGDFNGDGIPDLITADSGSNAATILLGGGDGSFTTAANSPVATGNDPSFVAVGDFNSDGNLDAAVANYNDGTVTILLGNGDGTFTQATGSPVRVGGGALSLAVGDLNGDGIADLAVANVKDNTVSVLLGNGSGAFTQAANSPIKVVGSSPSSVAIADFNRDGNSDLAVAIVGPNDVTVFLGNGDGTFRAAAGGPVPVGVTPYSIAVADFNGDGIPDLVTANDAVVNGNPGTLTILLGVGDGSFTQASGSPIPVGINPLIVAVGDFNADGKADLAVTNENDNTVAALLGNGDGTFMQTQGGRTPPGRFPQSVAVADFNGDGEADMAVTNSDLISNNSVMVLLTQITESASVTASGVSPAGTGTHLVEASYPGDTIYNSSISTAIGLLAPQGTPATPAVTVTPSPSSITTAQALTVAVAVNGGTGNPTPTGTVTLTSGTYTSAAAALSSGNASINIPAGSLAAGTDTVTANYTPDASSSTIYNSSIGSNSVTVTAAVNPAFSFSATSVTIAPGASNTAIITVIPTGGFTGSVVLTAAVTSSPAGAQDPPTLNFGSTSPVSIVGAAQGTATLTISTTAATMSSLVHPGRPAAVSWHSAGTAVLSLVLFFWTSARRRKFRTMLGVPILLVALTGGVLGCSGGGGSLTGPGGGGHGNPGTTAGNYTVTVTGVSGATTATGTLTLTVQ